ncbi:MAG TPA: hypothetical protein VNG95_00720 [Gemmatimonadales bacterium]|nr:hypothetical protein [Gemmatimonadales bacterium]
MQTSTRIALSLPAAAGLVLVLACGNTLGPPPPNYVNAVDTTSLFALDGTAVGLASAYNVLGIPPGPVNTEHEVNGFDFVFNITAGGQGVLLPTGAVPGLSKGSGLELTGQQFDSIRTAPSAGFADSTAVDIQPGSVVIVRSRPTACSYGPTVYEYAKARILVVDTIARRMDMEILVNSNCGYRDLQPGFPAH